MKARVINGFTDSKTNKNHQDNDIIDLSKERFEELKGIYVEEYVEPILENDNEELLKEISDLKVKVSELEIELEKANAVPKNAKDLKAANDDLTKANADLTAKVQELEVQVEALTKAGETNGEVQE